jgi:outer membrane protein TolC
MIPAWKLIRLLKQLAMVAVLDAVLGTPNFGFSQSTAVQPPASSPRVANEQTQSYGAGSSATATSTSGFAAGQSPYTSSVPEAKITPGVLQLSFKEAIDRALRNNLGLLLASDTTLAARGTRWEELSRLLPNLSASVNQSAQQIDLAALGFRFSFPGVSPVVGPIGTFDARAYVTAPLLDLHAFERERGAAANEAAARFTLKDARELVVLATGNTYLLAIAAAARVDAAQAQVESAQALYNKARDQQNAGLIPAIDGLRAQVEFQTRRQQLIVARNSFEKQRLTLARTIGLPIGQEFNLTERAPYAPLAAMSIGEALQRAYSSRPDYQAAMLQVRAAERFRFAATAEHLPSLQAEATLRQRRQLLDNLRAQIDYDVRTALLDLQAAADQVEVARTALDLANQTLDQARDRFTAGVADNLEVVQAQETVAAANENYIASLYSHNVAKVTLARAIGFAEEGVKQYLESK